MTKKREYLAKDHLPDKLPHINLRHGQVLWLLTEPGYHDDVSAGTVYEYIKSLRKLGIPFGYGRSKAARKRTIADYSYCRVVELAVTLSLRVYHLVPDAVLNGIVEFRDRLDRFYRRAYMQRTSRAGKPVVINLAGHPPIIFRGLFLDLNIKFSAGHMVRFGPPKLLSAADALRRFSQSIMSARPLMPLSLSLLSERIVGLALRVPIIRSGPHETNR
jgi:hypothetical protein